MTRFSLSVCPPSRQKTAARILLTQVLVALTLLLDGAGMLLFLPAHSWIPWYCLVGAVWILLRLPRMNRARNPLKDNLQLRILAIAAFLSAGILLFRSALPAAAAIQWTAGLLLALLAFTEYHSLSSARVDFQESCLRIPTPFGMRSIPWDRMNAVILRFDILTIDLKENRVIQLELEEEPGEEEYPDLLVFIEGHLPKPN